MAKSRGLGKGISSLITQVQTEEIPLITALESESVPVTGPATLPISDLRPNPYQPRKTIDASSLDELKASIAEHGVIQPILVRNTENGIEIVAGERRWRAAQLAGLAEVPVRMIQLTDAQSMELALVENLQREDLNAIEIALGIHDMVTKLSLTHEDAAKKLGISRAAVTNKLRLLQLPQSVLDMIVRGDITEGHARALLSLPDSEKMAEYAVMARDKNMTVRQLEELVRHADEASRIHKALPPRPAPLSEFQEDIDMISNKHNVSIKVAGTRKNMGLLIKGLKKWQVQVLIEYIKNNDEELFPAE